MEFFKQSLQATFGLSHEDFESILPYFSKKTLKKGEFVTKVGRSCDELIFIDSGYLRIFSLQQEKEVTQWVSGKGYFVTELSSFIFDYKSRFTIQAISTVEGFAIEKSNYVKLQQKLPDWNELEKRFIAHCFITLEDRVNQLLSLKAKERYQLLYHYNKDLFRNVPQQYLASMLGMSPETFSRIRAELIS